MSDALEAAERACVVEVTLSSLRHDLRNKLAAIRQAAFYLRAKVTKTPLWTSDGRVERFFSLMDDQIDAANELLVDESSLGRIHERRLSDVDLRSAIDRAVECAHPPEEVSIVSDVAPGHCYGDADEVALAIRCLVDNAIDATGDVGSIQIRGTTAGLRYEVRVIDRGGGIPAEDRSRLTKPFETTRLDRTGIGLSIAQRIAQRHDGELDFEDDGEEFSVVLRLGHGSTRRRL